MKYADASLTNYISDLSAKKSAPGGGSAAALAGAIGAALNGMVINFTIDKIKDRSLSGEFVAVKALQSDILKDLSGLIDKDCAVFNGLMAKLSRGKDAQPEYRKAAMTPINICEGTLASAKITFFLAVNGNKYLITDVSSAAHILEGAFSAAVENVLVNLRYITDRKYVLRMNKRLSSMKAAMKRIIPQIMEEVLKRQA
ncbi:MAG: cyclodeaminase/cyclohydrolase family protein [Candidatus Omnitrophica bacterium]|nr:cyclodeaminase/cyclohydrolase family protein [Candidatus Omnitrophota bacterium]